MNTEKHATKKKDVPERWVPLTHEEVTALVEELLAGQQRFGPEVERIISERLHEYLD